MLHSAQANALVLTPMCGLSALLAFLHPTLGFLLPEVGIPSFNVDSVNVRRLPTGFALRLRTVDETSGACRKSYIDLTLSG